MMFYSWGTGPDLWSGGAEEDLEAWLTEYAIWEAMAAGQAGNLPGQDDTPA